MPIGTKHCRNDIWKVLYKNVSFHFIQTKNISATGNSCFWLANLQKISSFLKLLFQLLTRFCRIWCLVRLQQKILILSCSVSHHGQFLFLIGWNCEKLLLWNYKSKWCVRWYEYHIRGPLHKFLLTKNVCHRYLFYWLAETLNIFFFSETISPTYLLLGTNHFCEVLSLLFLCCVYFLFCFFVFLKKIV